MTLPLDPEEPDHEATQGEPMTTTDAPPLDTTDAHAVEKPNLPAVPDANHPALVAKDEEWDGVDDGDNCPPDTAANWLTLIDFNAKSDGGILDTDTGERTMELEFIWLARFTTRAYFPKPYVAGQSPLCRSDDGIVGNGDYGPGSEDNPTGKCAGCPMAGWVDNVAPPCSESVEAMIFLQDPHAAGRLARIRFGGLSVSPAKAYWRSFSERMPRRPPIAYVTQVELDHVDTPNGRFLKAAFRRVSELTRAQAQPLIVERDRRLAEFKVIAAEEAASRVAPSDDEQPGGPFDNTQTPPNEEPFS